MSRPEIVLHAKPYRHYTINGSRDTPTGDRIVSVTQVLGVLDKPALVPWAERETARGAWLLARRKGYRVPDTADQFLRDVRSAGLDATSRKDDAAERGKAVHAALEGWIESKAIPTVTAFPAHWRGYFRSLAGFLMTFEGEFVESELAVGSLTHGFAGTRDTVAVAITSKGRTMLDLKTSKRCYPGSHFPQLAAYELAGVECGELPTDRQGIVVLPGDGTFDRERDIHFSTASGEDFLTVLRTYRSQHRLTSTSKRR